MHARRIALSLFSLMLVGCGSDPLAYAPVAGTYSGAFVAEEPGGDEMVGTFEVTLSQTDEMVTGSFDLEATINGRTDSSADGGLTATLPLGPNPVFDIEVAYTFCPQGIMTFTASYSSSTGTLTVVGDLDIPSSQCNVLTFYPLDIVLTPSAP